MPLNSGSKNWGRILLPGLRTIFFETYKEKPEQFSQVFNVDDSTKAIETDLRMGGFSEWNEKGTLDATEYEDTTDALPIQYRHTTFSKGFTVERELIDDEQYGVIKKKPKALARAARATIESKAASVLNNAFDPNAATSVLNIIDEKEALVAMSHVRLDKKTGGTQNMVQGNPALSESALEDALKLASEQTDEKGLKIQVMPKLLVVPRALEFVAEKIARSAQLPGTNWNDVNPMQGRFNVVVLDYLVSDTSWFLIDPTMNPLQFFWREKLNFKSTDDFDTDVYKYKGRMRFSYGWSDWRGIIGSKGDGSPS